MRSSHLTCVRLCPFLLATAALAPAQVIVPPGFYVTSYPIGVQVTGLDIAPPGPFGERLFLSVSGSVRVVDTLSGSVTTFATGLATGSSAPSGIEFDEGTFGTGELFIAQNLGNVRQVDPSAAHSQFATGGGLNSCNDITFSDPTGPFGAYAFVSNGAFTGGSVSRVDANGSVTPFAAGANMTTALGLAFPPQGSAFGNDLFVADTSGQRVLRIDTAGTITVFASNLQGPTDLAFSTSTAFGDLLYVSDLTSDDVKTIDPQGNVAVFATGLTIDNSGWNGDILFDSFGDALYVANDTLLLRISGEPDIPFCHGNGAVVPCPCGNTAPLLARSGCLNSTGLGGRLDTLGSNSIAASSLAFRASQMPSTTYCILFAGSDLVPETVIGDGLRCVGGSIIRFGVMQANGAGSTSWGPGLNALLGWSPGTSLRFQVWYRDAFVGPCGTHFNVTNASQVTAAP